MSRGNKPIFKVALLSISLMLTTGGSIAATVSKMQEAFGDKSATAVESLVTASNITVLIFVLISALLVQMFGTKKVVLTGIFLSTISGVVPVFTDSYVLIYISRLFLGAGFGMFNSLAVSLINDFYKGHEQSKMLGYQAAVQSLGQTFCTFIAGILVNYNWHYAYLIYFFSVIPFVLYLMVIPDISEKKQIKEKVRPKVNIFVVLSSLALFITFSIMMAVFLKATALVQENSINNASFIGTALSINTLISFLGSFMYGHVVKITKTYTLTISYMIIGVSFILISAAHTMTLLTLALALGGLGGALLLPNAFGTIMSNAPVASEHLAVSLVMVGANLGSFCSPFILSAIGDLFGNSTASFSFFAGAILFLILGVIYILVGQRLSHRQKVMVEKTLL